MNPLIEAVQTKESVETELLNRPGVTGVDVGYKYVDGQRTDEIAIRVHVQKKLDNVPDEQKVPEEINGIKTDVIERTYVLHQFSNRKPVADIRIMSDTGHYDPLRGGVSIGPCRAVGGFVFAGTLGAVVRDNATGNPMLLSNFHVMCVDNGWHVGDQMCQPSRVDTGACPADVVGALQRATLSASVDGAVCSVSARSTACEIVDIGGVTGTATVVLGQAVRKRGRTTALTFGFVDSISLSVNIDYEDGLGMRTLTNQISIRPDTAHNPLFGDHGDSGSVVVNDARQVVGLYFAGGDGFGVANPIAAVLSALNVSICVAPPATLKFADDKPLPTLKFLEDVPPPTLKFRDDLPPPTLKFSEDVPPPTLKFRDDLPPPTLKFSEDVAPPTLKFRDDLLPPTTNKFLDDGPGSMKFSDDFKNPASDVGFGGKPGGGAPFALATPHHSTAWRESFPEAYQQAVAECEAKLAQYQQILSEMDQAYQRGELSQDELAQFGAMVQEYDTILAEYQQLTGT